MTRILNTNPLKNPLWAGFLLCLIFLGGAFFSPLQAQTRSWIQVEAKNNILETRQRARFFARDFPDTHAFSTKSGWYVLAIGPMGNAEARRTLVRLKRENRIPRDSFVTDGSTFLTQLWPLTANVAPPPEQGKKAPPAPLVSAPAGTALRSKIPRIATGPVPDPDIQATRRAERGWSRDLRKEYQTYMLWTGDYKGRIDGSYGPGTRRAIRKFQTREGFQATGYLTAAQGALLKKRYQDTAARIGIDTLRNLDAGIEMKYPSNLVEFKRFDPPFVRYGPRNGSKIRMMLISQKGGRKVLNSLYNVMETLDFIPPGGYRMKKRNWFVLSGGNDKVVSYTYAKTANGKIKGFTLIWPPEMDKVMQAVVLVMYNSFTPLNKYVLDEDLGSRSTQDAPVDMIPDIDVKEPEHTATGFIINDDGDVLTDAANVAGCARITFANGLALGTVATDSALSLAVLRPKTAYIPKAIARFSEEMPGLGTAITAAGFSFPDVMERATLNYGTITDTKGPADDNSRLRVSAFLEDGDVGGPVLDDRGAVLAMDLARPAAKTDLPEYVNFAAKSNRITDFLDRNRIAYDISRTIDPVAPEDLALMAADFTVKVSCWKQ